MAHFAELDENNQVLQVIVINNEVLSDDEETSGLDFLNQLFPGKVFKQTSYNGNIRGTYAGIGYTYNPEEDIFIAPQPYPSWIRNGSFWQAPVPMPTDEKPYVWDEETVSWKEPK